MVDTTTELLDLQALRQSPLNTDPFDYIVVPNFVSGAALAAVNRDYPQVPGAGSYPPSELTVGGAFADLLAVLDGPEFAAAMAEKFAIDLSSYPTMFTVRGYCRLGDGKIHPDTDSKIITVLLYLNDEWQDSSGRLRLLRSADNLEDYVAEVPPHGGTLLAFRRCDHSWHGHEPFEGQRRAIQMNWVISDGVVRREQRRHRVSAMAKRLNPFS